MAFSPFIISKDVYGKILILDLYLLQIHFGFSSFSHPVNAVEACGLLTPLHIVPEWYFLCQYAMLKAVPQIKMQDSLSFILFYFMRRLSMSFYVKIKTSSRFNGFYRNPAGLPSFTIARVAPTRVAPTSVAPARVAAELGLGCPARVAPARVTLPSPGCPGRVPRLLTSPTQELCTFSATALRTSSSSRAGEASSSFSMKFCLVAELGFKCEGPCQSSLLINCQGFPLVVTPARAPPGLPPPRLTYIYIYIYVEREI